MVITEKMKLMIVTGYLTLCGVVVIIGFAI